MADSNSDKQSKMPNERSDPTMAPREESLGIRFVKSFIRAVYMILIIFMVIYFYHWALDDHFYRTLATVFTIKFLSELFAWPMSIRGIYHSHFSHVGELAPENSSDNKQPKEEDDNEHIHPEKQEHSETLETQSSNNVQEDNSCLESDGVSEDGKTTLISLEENGEEPELRRDASDDSKPQDSDAISSVSQDTNNEESEKPNIPSTKPNQ